MISKTIGFRGFPNIFRHTQMILNMFILMLLPRSSPILSLTSTTTPGCSRKKKKRLFEIFGTQILAIGDHWGSWSQIWVISSNIFEQMNPPKNFGLRLVFLTSALPKRISPHIFLQTMGWLKNKQPDPPENGRISLQYFDDLEFYFFCLALIDRGLFWWVWGQDATLATSIIFRVPTSE